MVLTYNRISDFKNGYVLKILYLQDIYFLNMIMKVERPHLKVMPKLFTFFDI